MGKFVPIMFIAISAALWGIIAIFIRKLAGFGFTSMEIVTLRVVSAAILLGLIGMLNFKEQLKIRFSDTKYFIGTGVFSIVLFNWCYFTSINQMSLSFAVILLYTAPAFVVVLSFLFLKEKMDKMKIVSVLGTLAGCVLIAGVGVFDTISFSLVGIITGVGAGFGYALYSIFGKFALRKYSPFTVTFYTFLVASIALLPFTSLWKKASILATGEVLFFGIGLGLFPTVLAYLLYTKGLEKMESSKAAIVATVEPVVATLLSVFLYNEGFGFMQLIGSLFILLSVILINIPTFSFRKNNTKKATIQ